MSFGHYQYLDWIAEQSTPFTATGEFLEAWASFKGVYRKTATYATGTGTFTGPVNTDIPPGTDVIRSDGFIYATDSDAFIEGNVATITSTFTASQAGTLGNAPAGITLTLGTPIQGVSLNVPVTSAVTGGTDIETDDSLRTRMLQQFAAPPQGGSVTDYVEWAEAVPQVTRAWCLPNGFGLGSVVVWIMCDIEQAAFNGFPQGTNGGATLETRIPDATGDQLAVANYIYPLRPVTSLVYVAAPLAAPINIVIQDLNPNTTAIQSAIIAAIADQFVQIGNPSGTLANPQYVFQSQITDAIESVPGIVNYTLTSPVTKIYVNSGTLPVIGSISFSS